MVILLRPRGYGVEAGSFAVLQQKLGVGQGIDEQIVLHQLGGGDEMRFRVLRLQGQPVLRHSQGDATGVQIAR